MSAQPAVWLKYFNATDAQHKQCLQSWPAREPFTFTHNDLCPANIMIYGGHVSRIIDWDEAGYYPLWYEYLTLRTEFRYGSFGNCVADYLDGISKASYPEIVTFKREFGRLIKKRLTKLKQLKQLYAPGKVPEDK